MNFSTRLSFFSLVLSISMAAFWFWQKVAQTCFICSPPSPSNWNQLVENEIMILNDSGRSSHNVIGVRVQTGFTRAPTADLCWSQIIFWNSNLQQYRSLLSTEYCLKRCQIADITKDLIDWLIFIQICNQQYVPSTFLANLKKVLPLAWLLIRLSIDFKMLKITNMLTTLPWVTWDL